MNRAHDPKDLSILAKCPTGIQGLDEITNGGLPKGRPTLVCGAAGCGKTMLAMEFVLRGALTYGEPGVVMAFEENAEELATNFASLGYNLNALVAKKKILLDNVSIERSEIEETGEYDLEGLFVRLGHAIDTIGAQRVVLDTVEALFAGFSNISILRAELRRLFRWLKDKGVTAIITGERGEGTLTRHGLEEYVADCVIVLDHRVEEQTSTRRMRILKYRGTAHGTNEYPFLIDEERITVLPVTSMGLAHAVSEKRVSSGIPRLDSMLGGKGYYQGSSVLVSGTSGTGKSSTAAAFAHATCERGERCLIFAFEESPHQIIRNMRSIGYDLGRWVKNGKLQIQATRPSYSGLETHLARMHKQVADFNPAVVVIDPITNFISVGQEDEVKAMLMRLIDMLKTQGITTLFTNLTRGAQLEHTDAAISSLMDTWILLRDIETAGERNRGIYVLKSRGMAHSNQIREFILTSHGIELRDVSLLGGGFYMGASRVENESQERAAAAARKLELARAEQANRRKKVLIEGQIAALTVELDSEEDDYRRLLAEQANHARRDAQDLAELAKARKSDSAQRLRSPKGAL
ncbi:MAG: circadian clock protein KaiC [Terriglobia bacterium]|jgi:circadian clock protein KaiC